MNVRELKAMIASIPPEFDDYHVELSLEESIQDFHGIVFYNTHRSQDAMLCDKVEYEYWKKRGYPVT